MIQIGDTILDLSDPVTLAALVTGLAILLVVILLIVAVRRAGKSAEAVQLVAAQLGRMSYDVQSLGQGQQQLAGNIQTVSDAQAKYSRTIDVLNALAAAKISNVTFNVNAWLFAFEYR